MTTKHADDEPVVFGYSSSRNVTFKGQDDSGFTWGEWREMTRAEQTEVLTDAVWDLVDLYIEDDEDVAADDPQPTEEAAR